MSNVTLSDFHQSQAQYAVAAQVESVELRSRGVQTRAALVSPALYEGAVETLEECRNRRIRDELDRRLRKDLAQVVRDYEENPDDVYMLDEIRAELGLK